MSSKKSLLRCEPDICRDESYQESSCGRRPRQRSAEVALHAAPRRDIQRSLRASDGQRESSTQTSACNEKEHTRPNTPNSQNSSPCPPGKTTTAPREDRAVRSVAWSPQKLSRGRVGTSRIGSWRRRRRRAQCCWRRCWRRPCPCCPCCPCPCCPCCPGRSRPRPAARFSAAFAAFAASLFGGGRERRGGRGGRGGGP